MLEMFDVEVTKHVNYNNYVSKDVVIDGRIILNGNRLFFLEPLESSSTQTYIEVARQFAMLIGDEVGKLNHQIPNYIKHLQNFVLWHYQFGSKYNTPFWDYAQQLVFNDHIFDYKLKESISTGWKDLHGEIMVHPDIGYAQWNNYAIKLWYEGMTISPVPPRCG